MRPVDVTGSVVEGMPTYSRSDRVAGVAPSWLLACALVIGCGLRVPLAVPQYATEGSLVLAGVVHYAPSALMNEYFLGTWTSLHQLGALLLLAGIDQTAVEYFFCVFPAGLLLCAMTMIVYGFTRRPLVSLAIATICFLSGVFASEFGSTDYPLLGAVWNSSREHTFGIWGGVMAAWTLGALAGGRNALAGFSAAALISVHPVIGAFATGATLVVWTAGRLLPALRPDGLGFGLAIGGALTLLSFGAYLLTRPPAPTDVDLAAFRTYMTVWDYHRSSVVDFGSMKTILRPHVQLAAGLALFLLASHGRSGAGDSGALALLVAIVGSVALYAAVHLDRAELPRIVVDAMPGRLLNIHAYVAGAIIFGLALWLAEQLPRLLSAVVRALTWRRTGFLAEERTYVAHILYLLFVVILALELDTGASVAAFADAAGSFAASGQAPRFMPDESDDFWKRVRETTLRGPVLSSWGPSFDVIRKGHIALAFTPDGFDFVPYLPYTAKQVKLFVESGYGVSFSDPPEALRKKGSLPGDPEREYWSRLDSDGWQTMAKELGIDGVIAPTQWPISLAPYIKGPQFTVYRIP